MSYEGEASGQLLSSEEADKVVRVARATARAQQVFAGQPAYAAAWLREPKFSLGYRTPLQLLATESGGTRCRGTTDRHRTRHVRVK